MIKRKIICLSALFFSIMAPVDDQTILTLHFDSGRTIVLSLEQSNQLKSVSKTIFNLIEGIGGDAIPLPELSVNSDTFEAILLPLLPELADLASNLAGIRNRLKKLSFEQLSSLIAMAGYLDIDHLYEPIAQTLLSDDVENKFMGNSKTFATIFNPIRRETNIVNILVRSLINNYSLVWVNPLIMNNADALEIAWNHDGTKLASSDYEEHVIRIWNFNAKKRQLLLERTLQYDSLFPSYIAWHPSGRYLASICSETRICIWDITTGKYTLFATIDTADAKVLAWSPQGDKLAIGGAGRVSIWDVQTRQKINTLTHYEMQMVLSLEWSNDGTRIACSTRSNAHSGKVYIWDIVTNELIHELSGHTGSVNTMAWSPDDEHIASGADDGAVDIWDAITGRIIQRLIGHTKPVNSVSWNPERRQLVSSSYDATMRIWNVGQKSAAYIFNYKTLVFSTKWSSHPALLANCVGKEIFVYDLNTMHKIENIMRENITIPQAMLLHYILEHERLPWEQSAYKETKIIFESLSRELQNIIVQWYNTQVKKRAAPQSINDTRISKKPYKG